MTTFEHAMLGVCGVLAFGLDRKHGWRLPAVAGAAAVTPDWDGLTLLVSVHLFDQGHRVWGHNLLVCGLIGVLVGWIDSKWDLVSRGQSLLLKILRQPPAASDPTRTAPRVTWCVVAMLAALSHLPADMVYSGGHGLSDWGVQLCWPFSTQGFVVPMVRWGDVGTTLIFVVALFAMLRWRNRLQIIAATTLFSVLCYILIRGLVFRADVP